MPRISGQVEPYIPSSAPMSYRLSHEVYSLDGIDPKTIGKGWIAAGALLMAYLLLKKK